MPKPTNMELVYINYGYYLHMLQNWKMKRLHFSHEAELHLHVSPYDAVFLEAQMKWIDKIYFFTISAVCT